MQKKEFLKQFLITEVTDKEEYEVIFHFVSSFDIRNGELEGNEYIIKKMDRENFIIFKEYVYPSPDKPELFQRDIFDCASVYKAELLKVMAKHAKKRALSE